MLPPLASWLLRYVVFYFPLNVSNTAFHLTHVQYRRPDLRVTITTRQSTNKI